jgi:nucleotide-binding universal stress UspA family protein
MTRIVVGVDGSKAADGALGFAVEEARLRGAALEVVHAFDVPQVSDTLFGADLIGELEDDARRVMADAVARHDLQGLDHSERLERGPAAWILMDAARKADMLVVGSRGRGGFVGLLLGSTSHQCLHHAPCPVVVVPARR